MGSSKTLILAAIGAAVLIALVLLFLKVQDSPAHEVDEDKLAQAQANYRRQRAAIERATPPPRMPERLEPKARAAPGRDPEPERVEPDPRDTADVFRKSNVRNTRAVPGSLPVDRGQTTAGTGGGTLKSRMDGANKLYDRADYEASREAALEVLKDHPDQVRMLRIVVSASCIMGDHDMAGDYFEKLTRHKDRDQMSRRCGRYGVELEP